MVSGLEVAHYLVIPTGGTAPKGFKTEIGPNLDLASYGLIESDSSSYPVRTRQNVMEADGTVIFGNAEAGGTKLTVDVARQMGKPCLINPTAHELQEWLIRFKIRILNVAGSRGSRLTGEQTEQIRETLRTTLTR